MTVGRSWIFTIWMKSINKFKDEWAEADDNVLGRDCWKKAEIRSIQSANVSRHWRQQLLQQQDGYVYCDKARKGEDGKPITLPRNLLAGANKSGVSKRDFITATGSIYVGDQYMDPEKVEHLNYKKLHTKAQFH